MQSLPWTFFLLDFRFTRNFPCLLLLQKWVNPRKSKLAGLLFPILFALCSANLPCCYLHAGKASALSVYKRLWSSIPSTIWLAACYLTVYA